jgi:hypothetical protein
MKEDSGVEDNNVKLLNSLLYLNNDNDSPNTSDNSKKKERDLDYGSNKSKTTDANNNLEDFEIVSTKIDGLKPSVKKLSRRNTVYNFKDSCLIEEISDTIPYNEKVMEISDNENFDSIYESKLNKSGFSLSELDNIKKKTIRNLKSYKRKFSTINIRVRKSIVNKLNDLNKRPYFERLIRKNGDANIDRINIEKHHQRYILDIFNTMVDMRWRSILVLFILSFLVSWTFFASLWFFLDDQCVANVKEDSFLDSFLFSIETQQTIGIN